VLVAAGGEPGAEETVDERRAAQVGGDAGHLYVRGVSNEADRCARAGYHRTGRSVSLLYVRARAPEADSVADADAANSSRIRPRLRRRIIVSFQM